MSFWIDPINFVIAWLKGLLESWGLQPGLVTFVMYLIGAFVTTLLAMLLVVFLIWLERKLIGRVQDRLGPNRLGPWGIFQTFADMLKIFTKEHITPDGADGVAYNLAPVISVGAVLMVWAVIPFTATVVGVDFNAGVLYLMAVGALGEMGVILAGWGSNNKYAMLAAFRAVAQLISYEVPMVLALMIPVMFTGSMSLQALVKEQDIWFIFLAPVAALIFFISSIAEVGRTPFDLVESESELVSGFNIEYSGLKFGMFYVADFLHAFTISLLFAALYLGGWRGPGAEQYPMLGFVYFALKTAVVYFIGILMRASLPRFRIDQMMDLNWKYLTPLALVLVAATAVAGKIVPAEMAGLRLVVMLALNGIIFVAADRLMTRRRSARRQVAQAPRPVAHYVQPAPTDPGD